MWAYTKGANIKNFFKSVSRLWASFETGHTIATACVCVCVFLRVYTDHTVPCMLIALIGESAASARHAPTPEWSNSLPVEARAALLQRYNQLNTQQHEQTAVKPVEGSGVTNWNNDMNLIYYTIRCICHQEMSALALVVQLDSGKAWIDTHGGEEMSESGFTLKQH